MIYIYVGAALSIWFIIAGIIAELKPRMRFYVTTVPISLAMLIGVLAGMVDEHLGYEHDFTPGFGSTHGFSFYEFLFMKNWAYSIFVICTAFTCYEFVKLFARKHKAKHPKRPISTGEFMRDLPDIGIPAKSSDYDLF